jgi:hypothetical protein
MKQEIDTEAKEATIEGIVESTSSYGYDSHPDVVLENGGDYSGASVASFIEGLPFVRKGKKIRVVIVVEDKEEKENLGRLED